MNGTSEQENVIRLTETAALQVKQLLEKESEPKGLRVFVETGGCSGMKYSMVLDEKRADDWSAEYHGVPVVVDPFSANYLRGSIVDFDEGLSGGGFKIRNPNARHSCGCGKSFEA